MKKTALLLVGVFFCLPSALVAELKIGSVDFKYLLANYSKAKAVENELNFRRLDYKRELETKTADRKALEAEIQKLNRRIADSPRDPSLLGEKEFKIADWQRASKDLSEFTQQEDRFLQDKMQFSRRRLFDDMTAVIEDYARAESYDLIFESSGESVNRVPVVLHSAKVMDITKVVLERLEAPRPPRILPTVAVRPSKLVPRKVRPLLPHEPFQEISVTVGMLVARVMLLRFRQTVNPARGSSRCSMRKS